MINEFSRVVVMGDILRPWKDKDNSVSGAFRNVQWMHHLIAPALRRLEIDVCVLDWSRFSSAIKYNRFDVAGFYQARGLDISYHNWSILANQNQPCPILAKYLEKHLQDALVVGYEMSKIQIATLDSIGIPYIDFVLHPVRFAPDLLHAARTNHPGVHRALQACHFDDSLLYQYAGDIMAKVCRFPKTIQAAQNSAILLGQVWTDRALSKPEGGFYKLESFAGDIAKALQRHSGLLYKPHPYEAESKEKTKITAMFKSIEMNLNNYYSLLCQPMVTSVYGLNSSGLYEAPYFGRHAHQLVDSQYKFNEGVAGDSIALGAFSTLSEIWTTELFWGSLSHCEETQLEANKNTMTPSRLRRSMNRDWGYGDIEKVVVKT